MESLRVAEIVIGGVGVIATLLGALYGINRYIDGRINKKLMTPNVLEAVARQLRPAVIFDSDSKIVSDQGALEYVAEIQVTKEDDFPAIPTEVLVKCKSYLAAAPLLQSLDVADLEIVPRRGKHFDWHFQLRGTGYLGSGLQVGRYRLEILR